MAYYIQHYGHKKIHWACVECLVRPMCNKRCNRTNYKHYLCERCNECNEFPCKEVEKLQMYERLLSTYGHQMMEVWDKHLKETSIFRLINLSRTSFDNWWVQK